VANAETQVKCYVQCSAEYSPASNKFSIYNKIAGSAVAAASEFFVIQAAREAVAENEADNPLHVTACFDGTWKKCGYISLNGIVSATSVDREKVLVFLISDVVHTVHGFS
jgi:hypothetical protein